MSKYVATCKCSLQTKNNIRKYGYIKLRPLPYETFYDLIMAVFSQTYVYKWT